jgi:hypothetical protein
MPVSATPLVMEPDRRPLVVWHMNDNGGNAERKRLRSESNVFEGEKSLIDNLVRVQGVA